MMKFRRGLVGIGILASLAFAGAAVANDSPSYSPPQASSGDSGGLAKARAAIAGKRYPEAIQILYPLSQSEPQNADVVNLLGFSYRMIGQYQQAFTYYNRALAIDPTHKGALEYEGEAYLETNQLTKAEGNLATLKRACGATGCTEIAQLQGAIERYKKRAATN